MSVEGTSTVIDLVVQRALDNPQNVALQIEVDGASLSYGELLSRAQHLSKYIATTVDYDVPYSKFLSAVVFLLQESAHFPI